MIEQSLTFPCGLTVPNRIVKASMTERLAGADCRANKKLERLYETFAEGGAGLLLTGNVMVDSRYLEAPGNVVIEDESGLSELAAWARAGKARGAAVILQINQAGRQTPSAAAPTSVAPSAVPIASKFFAPPRAITEDEINEVIERFAYAARIAERAGFSGVEVHAAHGYLFSQFLSPRVNQRTDRWGGSIENRARILVRTVQRIREVVSPSFAVGVKINVEDFIKGGLSPEDALEAVKMLTPLGIDFIELTGGTHEYAVVFDRNHKGAGERTEGVFFQYALAVRAAAKVPVILTGGMRTREGMERAIELGACDMVGMARPLAIEPDLPRRLLSGKSDAARPITLDLPPPPRAALAELNWARVQLGRLARGRKPKLRISPKLALLRMILADMGFARRRRAYLARHPLPAFQPLPSKPIKAAA